MSPRRMWGAYDLTDGSYPTISGRVSDGRHGLQRGDSRRRWLRHGPGLSTSRGRDAEARRPTARLAPPRSDDSRHHARSPALAVVDAGNVKSLPAGAGGP